jgi:hypothetical protein
VKNFDVLLSSSKVQLCVLWCNAVHWKGLKLQVFHINARFIRTVPCVFEFYIFILVVALDDVLSICIQKRGNIQIFPYLIWLFIVELNGIIV